MISPQCDLHTRPSYFNQAKNEADFSHDYISGKHHQARKKKVLPLTMGSYMLTQCLFLLVELSGFFLLMFQMHEGGNNHRQQESKTPRENLKAYLPPRGSRKTILLDTLAEP